MQDDFKRYQDEFKNDQDEDKKPSGSKPNYLPVLLILGLFAMIFFMRTEITGSSVMTLSLSEFQDHLNNNRIKTIVVEGQEVLKGEFYEAIKDEEQRERTDFRVEVNKAYLEANLPAWQERYKDIERAPEVGREPVLLKKVDVVIKQPSRLLTFFMGLLPYLLLIGLFWFLLFRQFRSGGGNGGILSFGRSRATLAKEDTGVSFEDVAGIDEAKEEVCEIVKFLKHPKKFHEIGAHIPHGVLLIGMPGTGKTLLAKAIAGEAGVPFFSISGSDFVEMFVGVGASRVRDLFKRAKEQAPCIIFLDEIDAVGRKRGSGYGGGNDEREQTLNAILVEMDGFESDGGVIVIAATNRPDVLDPALRRPGRFDREIMVDLPDVDGREQILQVHAKKVKLDPAVDLKVIARGTPTFSGAELENLINEAALIAVLHDRTTVAQEDLDEARDKVRWGRQKKTRVVTEEDQMVTAYHEAGHALATIMLDDIDPLHKVSIIPRGMAMGSTMSLPEQDHYGHRKNQLLNRIKVLYGGRVAEEIFCKDISTGAQNDIERATHMARMMVTEWGMSDALGPIHYSQKEESAPAWAGGSGDSYTIGPEMVKKVDDEVQSILLSCYEEIQKILHEHKDSVEKTALALMRYESLSGEEVQALADGADVDSLKPEPTVRVLKTPEVARKEQAKKKIAAEKPAQDNIQIQPRPMDA